MCLDNDGRPSKCMCMHIVSEMSNAHVHSLPKHKLHSSAHAQKVSRLWIRHSFSSWIRVKDK